MLRNISYIKVQDLHSTYTHCTWYILLCSSFSFEVLTYKISFFNFRAEKINCLKICIVIYGFKVFLKSKWLNLIRITSNIYFFLSILFIKSYIFAQKCGTYIFVSSKQIDSYFDISWCLALLLCSPTIFILSNLFSLLLVVWTHS